MRIYLVRHGETDWNLEMRIQGQTDVPLNAVGIGQAEQCALFFNDNHYDYLYSSALQRAKKTAQIIASPNQTIKVYPELNERSFGLWETCLWDDIHRNNPDLEQQWRRNGKYFQPPQGESIQEMTTRVTKKIQEIVSDHLLSDNLLVVTHGGPLKVIVGNMMGVDGYITYNSLAMHNCCINIADYDGNSFKMERINYVHRPTTDC